MINIRVYSDGSATVATKPGGYAWVMIVNGEKHSEGSGHMELASNNDAELQGAIKGLEAAAVYLLQEAAGKFPLPDFKVTLISDSQIILNWISGAYQFKQVEKMQSFFRLRALVEKLKVETEWVKGHSGDLYNERCDELANIARTGQAKKPKKAKTPKITHHILPLWFKGVLKIVDLDKNLVEDYSEEKHGKQDSRLEFKD